MEYAVHDQILERDHVLVNAGRRAGWQTDQRKTPAAVRETGRECEGNRHTRGFEDDVIGVSRRFLHAEDVGEAQGPREPEFRFGNADDVDERSRQPGEHRAEQSESARPQDGHPVSRGDGRSPAGVKGGDAWLDKRSRPH
jgi:hypothetical protein